MGRPLHPRELRGRRGRLRECAARGDFSGAAELPVRPVAFVSGLQEISSLVHLFAGQLDLASLIQDQVKGMMVLALSRHFGGPEHGPGRIPTSATACGDGPWRQVHELLTRTFHIDRSSAFLERFLVAVH